MFSSRNKTVNILRRFQSGYVFQYAFVMIVGLIALVSWIFYKTMMGITRSVLPAA